MLILTAIRCFSITCNTPYSRALHQTSLNFNYALPYLDIQQFVSTIRERETERVWFGLVLGNIHLKLL